MVTCKGIRTETTMRYEITAEDLEQIVVDSIRRSLAFGVLDGDDVAVTFDVSSGGMLRGAAVVVKRVDVQE